MNDLSLVPAELAEMSLGRLVQLPAPQLHAVDCQLDQAIALLKRLRTRVDAALEARFGEEARSALLASGRDFGTTHLRVEGLQIKYELPKKVTWDQKKLKAIAERIAASGESVESYLEVKLAVPESRYTNWPPALREQFAAARTVEAGKPAITLSTPSEE